MMNKTPYQQLRQMGFVVNRLAAAANLDTYDPAVRRSFAVLQRDIKRTQDMLKDYEMFELEENSRKQASLLPKVLKSLVAVRQSLLKTSEYELISTVDVIQISAELDELIDRMR